jgi:hypothetical protein
MSDIIERLQSIANCNPDSDVDSTISVACRDAIAEITRLRTELEQLRAIAGKTTAEGQSFEDIKRNSKRSPYEEEIASQDRMVAWARKEGE